MEEKFSKSNYIKDHLKALGLNPNIISDNKKLRKERNLYKHRCEVANDFIESRKDAMIIDHYDDLKYILNECDMESTW